MLPNKPRGVPRANDRRVLTGMADRGYDADWIRELAMRRGAWANIPPKRNRTDPICFSPYLYRDRNRIERSSNAAGWRRATTNWLPTILRLFSLRQLGCGSALQGTLANVHGRKRVSE